MRSRRLCASLLCSSSGKRREPRSRSRRGNSRASCATKCTSTASTALNKTIATNLTQERLPLTESSQSARSCRIKTSRRARPNLKSKRSPKTKTFKERKTSPNSSWRKGGVQFLTTLIKRDRRSNSSKRPSSRLLGRKMLRRSWRSSDKKR